MTRISTKESDSLRHWRPVPAMTVTESPRSRVCSLSCSFKITLPSNTMANSSEMDGVACLPVRPPGLMMSIEARNCEALDSEPSDAISARDQSRAMWARSLARTILTTCWVTPSALAIFSMEEIEGEHWPFPICDKKLAEKSVRSASLLRKPLLLCQITQRVPERLFNHLSGIRRDDRREGCQIRVASHFANSRRCIQNRHVRGNDMPDIPCPARGV
jgi:hypothetical protein